MINLLFFARLRETLDCSEMLVEYRAGESVADLAARLASEQGEAWQLLLHDDTRCAINQDIVDTSTLLNDGDELAFFPPVTGG